MKGDWIIVAGKGLTTDPANKKSKNSIRQVIVDEIQKKYCIKCHIHKRNKGRIMLDNADIKLYISRKSQIQGSNAKIKVFTLEIE